MRDKSEGIESFITGRMVANIGCDVCPKCSSRNRGRYLISNRKFHFSLFGSYTTDKDMYYCKDCGAKWESKEYNVPNNADDRMQLYKDDTLW